MKRAAIFYVLGALSMGCYVGTREPETIVQWGLKLAALQADYDFVAAPKDPHAVTYDTRALLAQAEPPPATKPAKKAPKR